jgi:hypothetical protein
MPSPIDLSSWGIETDYGYHTALNNSFKKQAFGYLLFKKNYKPIFPLPNIYDEVREDNHYFKNKRNGLS